MQSPNAPRPVDHAMFANRRYKVALTVAVVLFAVTLTATVLVMIIADAREEIRETEFETTLTAIHADIALTQAADDAIPLIDSDLPPFTPGVFAFAVRTGDPRFSRAADCADPVLRGEVRDLDGMPTDAYQVQVWGDRMPLQIVLTGEPAGQTTGQWLVNLDELVHRRVWAQLVAGGRFYADPVEIIFEAGVCDRAQAMVVFEQRAPLD